MTKAASMQQTSDESRQNSEEESDRQTDMVNIASMSFNNISSSIITRLETYSKQKRAKIEYKVDMDSHHN